MVRRMVTEPKIAFAGAMLETSFARFSPSIAAFSDERTSFLPYGRWEPSAIVETQSSYEKGV